MQFFSGANYTELGFIVKTNSGDSVLFAPAEYLFRKIGFHLFLFNNSFVGHS